MSRSLEMLRFHSYITLIWIVLSDWEQSWFFSPVARDALPYCDSLYLSGGYPKIHLDSLANNSSLVQSLIDHAQTGKPILAECGGMLFLLESLTDAGGKCAKMAAVIPGKARLLPRLANLGLHSVALPEGELRGHTFHYLVTETTLSPVAFSAGKRGKPEPVYQVGRTYATYMHLYFPSNQHAIGKIFSP